MKFPELGMKNWTVEEVQMFVVQWERTQNGEYIYGHYFIWPISFVTSRRCSEHPLAGHSVTAITWYASRFFNLRLCAILHVSLTSGSSAADRIIFGQKVIEPYGHKLFPLAICLIFTTPKDAANKGAWGNNVYRKSWINFTLSWFWKKGHAVYRIDTTSNWIDYTVILRLTSDPANEFFG